MSDFVEKLRSLHVWPQATADTWPDIILPRHIDGLYAVGAVAHEAAARIEQLEAALREADKALVAADEFINNGIDFGYIRMPDPDSKDSALKAPSLVVCALQKVSQALQEIGDED